MDAAEFAGMIDHTLLKPEATGCQMDRLCDEAVQYGFCCVIVNPIFVARAVKRLDGSGMRVGTVASFPLGAATPSAIVEDARSAIDAGACEIDMVAWVGGIIDGDRRSVAQTIYEVACAVHGQDRRNLLKVILETTALTDEQIILGCRCCAEGEADFVKTSTGFHASGGASVAHVSLLRRHCAPLKVKASGGIRTLETAAALLDAGASRLGTSSGVALMQEFGAR